MRREESTVGDERLVVRDLEKSFDAAGETRNGEDGERVEILRGVDLEIGAGESLAVLGPSGSGKSTLLHVLGALEPPTSGEVILGDVRPYELEGDELARFRNRTVGFVFQEHHLLPQYSVLENVLIPTFAFPSEDATGDEARAQELLERVGLSHRLSHRPAELSGGERQRVAVARALINAPLLLLCDEPTGSLDQRTADSVADLLVEMHEAERTILLVVTHSLDLAERFDRRVELVEGVCEER